MNDEVRKEKRADAATEASTESVQLAPLAAAPKSHSSEKPVPAKEAMAGVSAPSPMVARFNSTGVRRWRVQSGKLESSDDGGQVWNQSNPVKNAQLTTVVAAGDTVWAGGKAGTVFVSRDRGQSWLKVSLTGDDVIPLGDVTAISLAIGRVDVILATGDDWQSTDAGKSFRLLPRKP